MRNVFKPEELELVLNVYARVPMPWGIFPLIPIVVVILEEQWRHSQHHPPPPPAVNGVKADAS